MFKRFIAPSQFYKNVLVVAIPFMLQQLITSSLNLVDNLMVGQLGGIALGGVAITNRFFMVGIFATFGVTGAASIFIAQYFGAKDEENIKQAFRYSLTAVYLVMLPFIILGLLIPQTVLGFFSQDPAILQAGTEYIRIVAFAFLPLGLTFALASAMRSVGETKIPLVISIVAVSMNAILNYVLIFGHFGLPALGVAGAAYATVISRFFEMIALLVSLKMKHFTFSTKPSQVFHISSYNLKTITIKALPLTINEFLWSAGMATLFKLYATRGSEVISGMSIASTTADLFFVLFGGMAVATTVMISQPLGANELEEARTRGYYMLGFSIVLALFLGSLMFISSIAVPQFYQVSQTEREIASSVLRIMSLMFVIYMSNAECYFILRAGGDMKSTLIMDSVFMWLVNVPAVFIAATFTSWPILAIYLVGQSTDFLKLLISYALVKKEKWVKNLTLQNT
ncbi:MAG: MATE family efflux transporter [Erysipelotrichaceae bacterium]|nr:MATE family efflux transporter [Erysipelotrichaceae bacterium]